MMTYRTAVLAEGFRRKHRKYVYINVSKELHERTVRVAIKQNSLIGDLLDKAINAALSEARSGDRGHISVRGETHAKIVAYCTRYGISQHAFVTKMMKGIVP